MRGRGKGERIRKYYGVPAKVGMSVLIAQKLAQIVGYYGDYLRVRFPDEPILGIRSAHPTWSVVYPCEKCGLLNAHTYPCVSVRKPEEKWGEGACKECGFFGGHDYRCSKVNRSQGWTDPEDDPLARGKAEDAYLNALIGESQCSTS